MNILYSHRSVSFTFSEPFEWTMSNFKKKDGISISLEKCYFPRNSFLYTLRQIYYAVFANSFSNKKYPRLLHTLLL